MAIVRHKQPPLRRLMMYGVDHVRQAFASLGELWRNPLASLMTLAVLGVSLALPSCFHVLLKNAEVVEGSWQTSSQISLSAQGSAGAEHPRHEAADPALSGGGVRHLYEP